MVVRHEYAEVPRRVEYELTDLGRTLLPAIDALTEWAETHGAAVVDALDAEEAIRVEPAQSRNASAIA
jgi:DNA-binding HxlR family transcriptional regulator